jgi:hypothetical protein
MSQNILEQELSYILSFFSREDGFCENYLTNFASWKVKDIFLEIGRHGYQEIENFVLISKMWIHLCDSQQTKKWDLAKLAFENGFTV